MLKTKFKLVSVICLSLILVFAFCGCSMTEESEKARDICEEFVGYAVEDDYHSAFDMVKEIANEDDFDYLWSYMRDALGDSSTFELEQLGWNKRVDNGESYSMVTFEITTDKDKVCHAQVVLYDDYSSLFGFNFIDSTEFVESTEYTVYVNAALKVVSIALFGLTVWAFIDCIRRRVKNKVIWAIAIIVGIAFSLSIGAENIGFNFNISLVFSQLGMVANRLEHSVTTTVGIPLGTIIYFIVRKRITVDDKDEGEAGSVNEASVENASESSEDSKVQNELDNNEENITEAAEENKAQSGLEDTENNN